jgi:hypothetical protein
MKSFAADVASSPTADITIYEVRIRLDSHKSVRPFKGIICDDVSEFESCMASHAVASLWARQASFFSRLMENGPDIDFQEQFMWKPDLVEVSVDFWADEAVAQTLRSPAAKR